MHSKYPYVSNHKCLECSNLITIHQSNDLAKKYCSPKCSHLGKRVRMVAPCCKTCGKSIPIGRSRDYQKRFCNRVCAGKDNLRDNHECLNCKESYYPKFAGQKCCSKTCATALQRSTYTKTCEWCGDEFILKNKAYERRGKGRFCSVRCSNRKYAVNEQYFDVIDSEEKAYWLGFIFADGYNSNDELTINLSVKDVSHLEHFKKALAADNPIAHKENAKVSFRVASRHMCTSLSMLNCVRNKTFTLEPPNLASDMIPHFVRGFFDGDGCIYLNKKEDQIRSAKMSIHCASPVFVRWLLKTLQEQGIHGVYNPASQNSRNVTVSNKQGILDFMNYIYPTDNVVCLERKRAKFLQAREWITA